MFKGTDSIVLSAFRLIGGSILTVRWFPIDLWNFDPKFKVGLIVELVPCKENTLVPGFLFSRLIFAGIKEWSCKVKIWWDSDFTFWVVLHGCVFFIVRVSWRGKQVSFESFFWQRQFEWAVGAVFFIVIFIVKQMSCEYCVVYANIFALLRFQYREGSQLSSLFVCIWIM